MNVKYSARQWIIGVDVGGTKIAAAAVNPRDGALAHRREIATRAERAAKDVLEDIAQLAELVAADVHANGGDVAGVGIGVPEIVDGQGNIRSAYLFDWNTISLAGRLTDTASVRFESDVRAAALAESRFGAGKPYRLFVYISAGTGISSTLVQDGAPLVGARGGAVVLSTAPISVPDKACGAWSEFVLEDFASGRAIAGRYREVSGNATEEARDVILAATSGDKDAIVIVDSAAYALGSAIGWLVNVLDPEAVIIGGGLSCAGGRYWDALTQSTRTHIWHDGARDLPILPGALGADAGVIGAALAACRGVSPRDVRTGPSLTAMNRKEVAPRWAGSGRRPTPRPKMYDRERSAR